MTQVSLSNISLSFLKNQINLKNEISFSQLYNYNTDISKIGQLNISDLIGKFRTFVPTDISNLTNWFDANNLHYADYLTNNKLISQWNDISGNNNNAIQYNTLLQPYYNNCGLNAKPCVSFNSQTNYLSYLNINSQYQTNAITIAVVFNTSGLKSNYIFSCQDITIKHTSKSPIINVNTNTNYLNTISNFKFLDNVPNIYIASIYIDTDGYTKSQFNYNGNSNNLFIHDNSLTTLNINNIYIGGSPLNTNNTLYGSISELIIYKKKLDKYNIQLLEGYLSSKWWGVPSYLLPNDHIYYNISVLEPNKSPMLLYNFDTSTSLSNILSLNNYGLKSYYLNGIIDNTNYFIQSPYYTGYDNHLNDLSIWYKFDYSDNLIYKNNGFSGSVYDLIISNGNNSYIIDYIRGDGSLKLTYTDIATTNTSLNLINFGTYSSEYTIAFWYKVTAFNDFGNDTLFSLSGATNNGSKFFIKRDQTTNNIIIGVPFNSSTISIPNSIYQDDKWRHIGVCLKKSGNNNLILNIYLNGIIIIKNLILINSWFSNSNSNYIVLNQYSTGLDLYSTYGANMLYDDFRFYVKSLTEFQLQSIMGYPISRQYGNKNTFGYFWNSYNTFSLNINTNLKLDYTSFINTYFIPNNFITICYNLKIIPDISYNNTYEINIIHCNNNNIDKLKIIHRFFTTSTNYIKVIINDSNTLSKMLYFPITYNDNLRHNYIFKIPITLSSPNTITFYNDGLIKNSINISDSSVNEPIINQQFVKIGSYNNSLSNINIAPFILEDIKIYNREITYNEIYYINSNFNIISPNSYYTSNIYPFNYLLLNKCNSPLNYYGPSYNNIINNYSSNGSWIFDKNNINNYNGIQIFTVPKSGYYSIISAGACGGKSFTTNSYGKGIILKNYVYLSMYDKLYILVGQKGGDGSYSTKQNETNLHGQGGGGGGTYIVKYVDQNNMEIILISGGGGGSGEYIINGEDSIGTDAVYTTSGNLDSANVGIYSVNGNGGNIGLYGITKGTGFGGGGYYTDGVNKINTYGSLYYGISFLNILNGKNIGLPYSQNYGGFGGFGGGATGGSTYSPDLVWGGGGGGGYSGGVGGSASYYQGQTHGGGGGGSYDKNNITNNGTVIISEGINGYNNDDGYVKIQFLTSYNFLDYANINSKINRSGLTFLIEPSNKLCYNINYSPSSIINLVNGTYASLNGYYDNTDNSIILDNFSIYNDANKSFLNVNTKDDIKSVSLWYKILTEPVDNSCFIDTLKNNGYIYDKNVAKDWNDGVVNTKEGGKMYINSSNTPSIINWSNLIYPLNIWKNITLISNSNLSNEIVFFNNNSRNGGINIEFGPIMVYNRILTSQEHLLNYMAYANLYQSVYKFFYTGNNQFYTVPPNIYKISVKCYGSGGGCGGYNNKAGSANGGAGIFISCIINVEPNDILKIIVPSGGGYGKDNEISLGGYPSGGKGGYRSGGGGGYCSIMKNSEYLLIAAGGSGGGYFYGIYDNVNTPLFTNDYTRGGNAGFLIGETINGLESGNPGTQNNGGIAYQIVVNNFNIAENGLKYTGSSGGINYGGGSGQGYYSGSGGGEKQYFICGGSGSSSYVSSKCENIYYEIGNSSGFAPGQSDIDYPGQGICFGSSTNSGNNGGNGYCVIKNFS